MQFRIDLIVRLETPLNVGTGALTGVFADRPLLKDSLGYPYVPGSTLKGKLRHAYEQLARGLWAEQNRDWPHDCHAPTPDAMCQRDPDDEASFCPVCRVFGAPWLPSRISCDDLMLHEPAYLREERRRAQHNPMPTSLRHGVSLSRRRRVAEEARLYTTEIWMPGAKPAFRGEIRGDVERDELALLSVALDNLIALGGGKTGGLGWCTIEQAVSVFEKGRWRELDNTALRQEVAI
jgi:CRISPR/Cas system CSM-associated protein Csm3 (group 7 of RAMP superfamily)